MLSPLAGANPPAAASGAGKAGHPPLTAELTLPRAPADEVREAADRILARAEFREEPKSLLQRAQDWLFERLGEILADLFQGEGGTVLGWIILAVLVAASVFFAVRFGRGVSRDPGLRVGPPVAPRRSAADWRADAEANEAAGNWRGGLRCRYRALVGDLAVRGVLEEVPGRTAGEYRGQLGANLPAAAADFGGATALFEAAWYGNRPTGPDESARFKALAESVVAA